MSLTKIELDALTDSTLYNNTEQAVEASAVNALIKEVTNSAHLKSTGTDGRVFFQKSGELGQNANFFWNDTTSRLSLGMGDSPSAVLDIKAQGALSTDLAFRVRNSTNNGDLLKVKANGHLELNNPTATNRAYIGGGNTDTALSAYANITVIGYSNSNAGYNTAILGHNNANASPYGALILGNSNNVNGGFGTTDKLLILGSQNTVHSCTVVGHSNSGYGADFFGSNNIMSESNGNAGVSVYGNYINVPNTPNINGSMVFGRNSSIGAPQMVLNQKNLMLGVVPWEASVDLNARNSLLIKNGTPPTTLASDSVSIYSKDVVAGNAAPHFRTENGSIIKLYQETTMVGWATTPGGIGTPITDDQTFDGYTVSQVVKALRNLGLLA